MELEIQDLVNSIKKDGLEKAQKEANQIIESAKANAAKILSDAKADAEVMLINAKKEISLLEQSAKATLAQASRNVSLELKQSILNQCNKILTNKISSDLDKKALTKMVEIVAKSEIGDCKIVVDKKDSNSVAKEVVEELAKKMDKGIELSLGQSRSTGIKIESKDGSAYIDLTDEEFSLLLKPYISSSLSEIIF